MATRAQEIVQDKHMTVVGDSGYYSAKELAKCEQENIEAVVAIPDKQKAQSERGYYPQSVFVYDAEEDCYRCPNQQILCENLLNAFRGALKRRIEKPSGK